MNIAFDQYQRYNNAANLINQLRLKNERLRILEVGANEHQNLEVFLPTDEIKYLDIKLPSHLLDNPKYLLGDATDMSFPDDSFDVVIALDVFEHIPPEKREKFIEELHRVCSQFSIITAPFDSTAVKQAESRVNNVYKYFFKQNYVWLEEHLLNGLPSQSGLVKQLNANNIPYHIMSHGNIDLWERIMNIHFIAAYNPDLIPYREVIDEFYNDYLFDYDYSDSDESYRKIVLIGKSRDLSVVKGIKRFSMPDKSLSKLSELESMFYRLASLSRKSETSSEELKANRIDRVQIYLDYSEGFSEENSFILSLEQEQLLNHYHKEFISPTRVKAIRIDPSDSPGAYSIRNVKFVGDDDKSTEYNIQGNYVYSFNDIFLYEESDPKLIFDFNSEINLRSVEFDIVNLSMDFRLSIQLFKDIFHKLERERAQLDLNLKKSEKLVEMNKENEKKLSDENEVLSERLKNKSDEIEKLLEDIKNMKIEYEGLKNSKERTVQESNVLKETILIKEKELKLREEELDNVYSSKSWRIVKNIKKIIGRH